MVACETQFHDVQSLNSYIRDEDHGLVKRHEKRGYDLRLLNRPTDLWVAQELRNELATDSLIADFRQQYDEHLYFILKISKNGKEALYASNNHGAFSDLLQNLSFRMGTFTEMVTSRKDTIPLADSHYSRIYGQSGATTVMLAFNREKIKNTKWVQVNLSDLGLGTGRTTYRFRTKDLLSAPSINFQSKR